MSTRKKLTVALSATMLILLLAAGAIGIGASRVAAATPNTGTPTTKTASKSALCADFQAKLAANLNVSQDQLLAALKKTALDEVNAAQQAGKLNATQAQKITARINQSNGASLCRLIAGRRGEHGKMARFHELRGALGSAAAQYFGISDQQFMQDLRATGTLQGVAAKYNKDNAQGKAGLEQALENALRQELAKKGVAQTRIDQAATRFKQNFDRLYTRKLERQGERGTMARGMFGMLRGPLSAAAAQYFGISEQQFTQDIQATGSLQGVAAKYNKDNAQGKAGLEQALENALRQTLASKNVPQARVDQMAQLFKQHFDQLYTHQFKGGQPGRAPSKSATPSS